MITGISAIVRSLLSFASLESSNCSGFRYSLIVISDVAWIITWTAFEINIRFSYASVPPLLDGISELLGSIIDGLVNITSFGTKFGEFLSGAFTFIPDEIITVLTLGVSLAILAIIFRILKG